MFWCLNKRYKFKMSKQQTCVFEEENIDNISIELQHSELNKPDSQLTEELYEIARRIAESDRDNEAYREVKKTKFVELEMLRKTQSEREDQLKAFNENIEAKRTQAREKNFTKNAKKKYDEICADVQRYEQKEKIVKKANLVRSTENQKLEKRLAAIQAELDSVVKQNKQKSAIIDKLEKQRVQKQALIKQNQFIINDLQENCEKSKIKAENLQNELKEELKVQSELQELINQKQMQLASRNHEKQEAAKRQEQYKREINKLANVAKNIENEIEEKLQQAEKLEEIHQEMRKKMSEMDQQQKKFEEIMAKRKILLSNLKNASQRATKQQETIQKLRNSQQDSQCL